VTRRLLVAKEADIAREVVTKCDKCGEPGDDVKTYTLRLDGKTVEIDLDDKHAKTVTITSAFSLGRVLTTGAKQGGASTTSLERRIRGIPEKD
jgi:hypothetical protein